MEKHCRTDYQYSLRKTVGRVSPILVTLTSLSDSNFERSKISLKKNKRDGVDSNSNGFNYCVRRKEGKIPRFSAAVPSVLSNHELFTNGNRTLGIISKICKLRGGTPALLRPVGTLQVLVWLDVGKNDSSSIK